MLESARAAAGGHPTPQSRMAASGLVVEGSSIRSPSGSIVTGAGHSARLVDVIGGAEFGSSAHRQFAPRNTRGYWLVPAADSEAALDAGDRALAEILRKVT